MKEFGIYIFELYMETADKYVAGISINDTEENARKQLTTLSWGVTHAKLVNKLTWRDFKPAFDTTDWPDFVKFNEDGLFEDEEFASVCIFAKAAISQLLSINNKTMFANINLN